MHTIPDRPWLRAAHSALVDAVEIQPVDVGRALFNRTHNYFTFIANVLNGHLLLETLTDEPPVLIVSAVDALGTAHVLTHLSGPMLGLADGPALAAAFAADGKRNNGRWRRDTITENSHLSPDESKAAWLQAMALAGLVLDHTPELVDAIISGDVALSDAADVGWRLPEAPTAPADASALLPDGSE